MAETLAERILRVVRIKHLEDMPLSQLGLNAGLSKDTVPGWIRKYKDKVQGGRTEQLMAFAKHYRVSSSWLVTGEGGPFGANDALETVINSDPTRYTALQQDLARRIRDARPGAAADVPPEVWKHRLELLRQAMEPVIRVEVYTDHVEYKTGTPGESETRVKPQASSRIRQK